jgi:hypothetical protein
MKCRRCKKRNYELDENGARWSVDERWDDDGVVVMCAEYIKNLLALGVAADAGILRR